MGRNLIPNNLNSRLAKEETATYSSKTVGKEIESEKILELDEK